MRLSGNLHELCRLLARIRANYQVSELYETPGDALHRLNSM
jgi:hypothetical protein